MPMIDLGLLIFVLAAALAMTVAAATAGDPQAVTRAQVDRYVAAAPPAHPRLFGREADFQRIRQTMPKDDDIRAIAARVIAEADSLLAAPPAERVLEGRRLLMVSRLCLQRTLALGMAWRLTGKPAYLERGRRELLAIVAFSDWNPSHFLDTAEMTLAMAVGYDWLYDQLDETDRAAIRAAIVEKGLRTSLKHTDWVRASNNWGQVCHGGIVGGALAVMESEPVLAAEIVHRAVVNVPCSVQAYAPNGGYPEGPAYWGYGTTYNVILLAELESALGTDFGLSSLPGFAETGQYINLATGPSGRFFNYADGGDQRGNEMALWWLARRFKHPDWLVMQEVPDLARRLRKNSKGQYDGEADRFLPLLLFWYTAAPAATPLRMPLNWQSAGHVPVAIFRTAWRDPNAVYLGFKGGSPAAAHGHMDAGSFVLEADGVRWALDLGAENYHKIEELKMNLWNMKQDSDRWTIFRLNNRSHNTLVIDDRLQHAAGFAPITAFRDDPQQPGAVMDLTAVYTGQVSRAERAVALLPTREVLIQDRLAGLTPGAKVRWGMVTRARIASAKDNVMTLSEAGQTLELRCVNPDSMVWKTFETETPPNAWDTPNKGTRMVGFEAVAPTSGSLDLQVLITPGSAITHSMANNSTRPPDLLDRRAKR